MPSTIPYDPSLVLGSIVDPTTIANVKKISDAQASPDAKQAELNSLMSLKRSLDMTKTELLQMGIKPDDASMKALDDELNTLDKTIPVAAAQYCDAKIGAEKVIAGLRSDLKSGVKVEYESPVDYVKTQIKTMPLAADSLNMDVQYFARDENNQSAQEWAAGLSSYVGTSTSGLGNEASLKATQAAQAQAANQASNHSIAGTLVLSVTCTHKNASIMAPFVLNVDKAVKAWNHFFTNKEDQLDPSHGSGMVEWATKPDPDLSKKLSIISGMTYGSSFIGMVHVLNTTNTSVSEQLATAASSLQAQMDVGGWFEKASGGFGVSATFANSVKNLLSSQNISSHVTLICMGTIPSMVASDVKMGVEQFAKFDPEASMKSIATIQNATVADQGSVSQAAEAARTGQQMVSIKATEIKSALSALSDIADGSNKVLDVTSMMTALDDYIQKASKGESGVPINYYLKDITKDMIAEMWVAKYYPGKYLAISWDDNKSKDPNNPGSGTGDK